MYVNLMGIIEGEIIYGFVDSVVIDCKVVLILCVFIILRLFIYIGFFVY